MEAIAKTRHLKGSPRKARLVIDLIRGRNVSQALAILKFTDKRAADPIAKTLRSAIANATFLAEQQNIAIDPDDLWVKTCFVDMGAHKNRRRMRPAPQGRAYKEQRHYCHITIQVSSDEQPTAKNISVKEKTSGEKKSKASGTSSNATKARHPEMKAGTVVTDKAEKQTKAEDSIVDENVTPSAMPIEESQSKKSTAPSKTDDGKDISDASDAKNVASQTPQERHENKPADQILDNNQSST
ncbi:MAG TPA: 50S ribosomal protein L22 [Pyrinomonadaceae bacterium]|jgi:large subunit ribosomal protein L22